MHEVVGMVCLVWGICIVFGIVYLVSVWCIWYGVFGMACLA